MASSSDSYVRWVAKESNGILKLAPSWVARDFLRSGHRLGLEEYSVEDKRRGEICERWFGSTARAENTYGPKDEGLSYIVCPDASRLLLLDAIRLAGELILGREYSMLHRGLNLFTKFFDFATPIPFHLHQMDRHIVPKGKNSKEEAYHFPEGVPMGAFPYSFLGVHPSIAKPENRTKLIPYLERWETDEILKFSRAYKLVPGEGFLLRSGTLHAPGTALTLEIQETSDVYNMFMPPPGDKPASRDLLWKDVDPEARSRNDLEALLDLVNWDVAGDPYFYEHYHLTPIPANTPVQTGGHEDWIFYGTRKFSGKKTVVNPNARFTFQERGAFTLFVWRGRGSINAVPVAAGGDHSQDEFFVVYDTARRPITVENTCQEDLVVFKFFGEDVNPDAPGVPAYP
jgi:hypothetical protein